MTNLSCEKGFSGTGHTLNICCMPSRLFDRRWENLGLVFHFVQRNWYPKCFKKGTQHLNSRMLHLKFLMWNRYSIASSRQPASMRTSMASLCLPVEFCSHGNSLLTTHHQQSLLLSLFFTLCFSWRSLFHPLFSLTYHLSTMSLPSFQGDNLRWIRRQTREGMDRIGGKLVRPVAI